MIQSIDIHTSINKHLNALQSLLQEKKLDAAIIYKPENVFYFSHFNPVLNSTPVFVIIPAKGDPTLLVHCIRYAHAQEEGAIGTVICYGKWGAAPSLCADPIDAIAKLVPTGLRLGLELDTLEVSKYQSITEKLSPKAIKNLSLPISLLKIKKDDYEISRIRRAAHLVDTGIAHTIEALKAGLSEADACTEGQQAMRKEWTATYPDSEISGFGTSEGGMPDSLQIWCLSNGHIAYGCDCSRPYTPKEGDIVLPMAWAKVDGYHAENERTLVKGTATGIRKEALAAIVEARHKVFQILHPGTTFEALYEAAMAVFTAHGFGDILPGRIGHGVGNSAHEFPSLTKGNTLPLEPGMVITIEPGLMDASWGGARHSDTVLITEGGYEKLTKLPDGYLTL